MTDHASAANAYGILVSRLSAGAVPQNSIVPSTPKYNDEGMLETWLQKPNWRIQLSNSTLNSMFDFSKVSQLYGYAGFLSTNTTISKNFTVLFMLLNNSVVRVTTDEKANMSGYDPGMLLNAMVGAPAPTTTIPSPPAVPISGNLLIAAGLAAMSFVMIAITYMYFRKRRMP